MYKKLNLESELKQHNRMSQMDIHENVIPFPLCEVNYFKIGNKSR